LKIFLFWEKIFFLKSTKKHLTKSQKYGIMVNSAALDRGPAAKINPLLFRKGLSKYNIGRGGVAPYRLN
jgi:hypothetical protein